MRRSTPFCLTSKLYFLKSKREFAISAGDSKKKYGGAGLQQPSAVDGYQMPGHMGEAVQQSTVTSVSGKFPSGVPA